LGRETAILVLTCIMLCVLIIPIFSLHVTASSLDSPNYWPTLGWQYSTPDEQGMNSTYLNNMMDYIANQNLPIDSVVIVRHGHVILEEYPSGIYSRNSTHELASVTKSFSSALIGIAIGEGHIDSVSHKVLDFFPNRTFANMNSWKQDMTLEHLLTMTSGLPWNDPDDQNSMENSADPVQFVLDRAMINEPGSVWRYNSGGSHLLSAAISKTTGFDALTYAREHLFDPLGISNVYWRKDKQDIPWGYAHLFMKPLDMAKFGYLYLHHGTWDGQQVVPAEWVVESTRPVVRLGDFEGYGYQWWTDNGTGAYDPYIFDARGGMGQRIVVVPNYDMVVVFTGSFEQGGFDEEDLLLHEFILKSRVRITGDVYFDWTVDIFDLAAVAISFGEPPPVWNMKADINRDGIVDIFDVTIVAVDFGKTN